jgi:hypothetical protein
MNTLLMLVMTVNAPAVDPMPMTQSVSSMPGSYSYGDSGYAPSSRPGLLARLRGFFGRSQVSESYPSTTSSYPMSSSSYPMSSSSVYSGSGVMSGTMTAERISPMPVTSPSTAPVVTSGPTPVPNAYSTGAYSRTPSYTSTTPPQRMPGGPMP